MDFEQRLRSHLIEQASSLEIETADPATIVTAPSRARSTITTLAALAVVLAGAAGFWLLASGDPGPVTEIAAGEAEDADQPHGTDRSGEESEGRASADVAGHQLLEFVDVTSENSPGFGRALSRDGVYYVLSSAPGWVDINDRSLTEEKLMELYRQNTFYVYDPADGWSANQMEDRFISDFDVADGVLYAVSTGSKSGMPGALGSSTDRGRTWTWTDITDLPDSDQLIMLRTEERTVLFASRRSDLDFDGAVKVAAEAGLPVTEFNLRDVDQHGFSYLDYDTEDPCAAVKARYLAEIGAFTAWIEDAPEDERTTVQQELEYMVQQMNEELAGYACEPFDQSVSIENIATLDLPDTIRVTWAEIGFTPPESWQPWSTVYIYDGQQFTDVGLPFDGDGDEISYASSDDGRLTIYTWNDEPGSEAEIRWSTSDGRDWEQEVVRYEDLAGGVVDQDQRPVPRAGDHRFRIWWDESQFEPEQSGNDYVEPRPLLQRSTSGGPFETVTLAELAPDVDVGDWQLVDVQGSPFGVFLIYGPPNELVGPVGGTLAVYSGNGVDWDTARFDGHSIEIVAATSTGSGDGTDVLLFSHRWSIRDGDRTTTTAYLVRPAG